MEQSGFTKEVEIPARGGEGAVGRFLFLFAVTWSLYQLYIASPLPSLTGVFWLNETQQRPLHLAFALFLAFCLYPAKPGPLERIPLYDWLLAALGSACVLYGFFFYEKLAIAAGGVRSRLEFAVAIIGLLCLLEATRRVVGLALVLVAGVFIAYAFAGPWMPEAIAHGGVSLNRALDHLWFTTEGVFGIPLGVSNTYIFLFVLFGALLDKAGAGNYFIQLSFSLIGHRRGGPAKAAVVSSGLVGLISGSALANVVTTGTFTIPLMKRMGFTAERAGAVETVASINGQIMPPMMGAAAFLMTEFVGIPYSEVIKHAILPAAISYIALYYIMHLQAQRENLPVIERQEQRPRRERTKQRLLLLATAALLVLLFYLAGASLVALISGLETPAAMLLFLALYLGLLWVATRVPPLEPMVAAEGRWLLPRFLPTLLSGLHHLLPVVILIWCLIVERFSPGTAVSWSIASIIVILLTQQPIAAAMKGERGGGLLLRRSFGELVEALAQGARNMAGIAVALAAAGIIVGVVSMTGIGQLMAEVIGSLAGDNIFLMLLAAAVMCIILGMGLPTTANYIVVVSVVAPSIVTLASQAGVIIPLIAVHFFVFYLGLVSGTTPPVAVDAFAAAAVARADPMRTAVLAFFYNLRILILPFIFVFNTELLLIGISGPWHLALTVCAAVIAMLAFAAAIERFFLVRSRPWESLALLLVAFLLLRPGFLIDQFYPRYEAVEPTRIFQLVESEPPEAQIRIRAAGESFSGGATSRVALLPLGAAERPGKERLQRSAGLTLAIEGERVQVIAVAFNGAADKWGIQQGWTVESIDLPAWQPDKQWLYIPAALLLLIVALLQSRRRASALAIAK